MPLDYKAKPGSGTIACEGFLRLELDTHHTKTLLTHAQGAFRTRPDQFLLTALVRTIGQWTQNSKQIVFLEGHGRNGNGEDFSRTVGWFTQLYPAVFETGRGEDLVCTLKKVKETVFGVPRGGGGYGLLRYGDSGKTDRRIDGPAPEILFNYMGRNRNVSGGQLQWVRSRQRFSSRHPHTPRSHIFEINAQVVHGRLSLRWSYSKNHHRRKTVQKLLDEFENQLLQLINRCGSGEVGGFTPRDFPNAALTQSELDRLTQGWSARQRGEVEYLSLLTPMQEGMLYHSLLSPGSSVYFLQRAFEIRQPLDVTCWVNAWNLVTARAPGHAEPDSVAGFAPTPPGGFAANPVAMEPGRCKRLDTNSERPLLEKTAAGRPEIGNSTQ